MLTEHRALATYVFSLQIPTGKIGCTMAATSSLDVIEPLLDNRTSEIYYLKHFNLDGLCRYVEKTMRDFACSSGNVPIRYRVLPKLETLMHFGDTQFVNVEVDIYHKKKWYQMGFLWYSPLVVPICYTHYGIGEPYNIYFSDKEKNVVMFNLPSTPKDCFAFNFMRVYNIYLDKTEPYLNLVTFKSVYKRLILNSFKTFDDTINSFDYYIPYSHRYSTIKFREIVDLKKSYQQNVDLKGYHRNPKLILNENKREDCPENRFTRNKGSSESKIAPPEEECKDAERTKPEPEPESEPFTGLFCQVSADKLVDDDGSVIEPFFFVQTENCEIHLISEKIIKSVKLFHENKNAFGEGVSILHIVPIEMFTIKEHYTKSMNKDCDSTLTASEALELDEFYYKILQLFESAFCESDQCLLSKEHIILADIVRYQYAMAINTDPEFEKLMNNYTNILRYDLFKADNRLCFVPMELKRLILMMPILFNIDDTLDISKITYSVLIEIFAQNLNSPSKRFPITNYRKSIIHSDRLRINLKLLLRISSVFTDPTTQLTEIENTNSIFKHVTDPDAPPIKGDNLSEDDITLLNTVAMRLDVWDMLCSEDPELTVWERTTSISPLRIITDAQKRAKKHQYYTCFQVQTAPKYHFHDTVTSVLLTTYDGTTKKFPVMRCPDCSTYGTRTTFKMPRHANQLNQYIKKKNVFTVHPYGPVIIVDYVAKTLLTYSSAPIPKEGIRFKSTVSKKRLQDLESQRDKLMRNLNNDDKKLRRLKRHAKDKWSHKLHLAIKKLEITVEETNQRLKEFPIYKHTDIFENLRFSLIVVKSLTTGEEHVIEPSALSCTHHHHCRTRPPHHKPIMWSKTDGEQNIELLKILPHTRLALAIQALFRMRRCRRRYLSFKVANQTFSLGFDSAMKATEATEAKEATETTEDTA